MSKYKTRFRTSGSKPGVEPEEEKYFVIRIFKVHEMSQTALVHGPGNLCISDELIESFSSQ